MEITMKLTIKEKCKLIHLIENDLTYYTSEIERLNKNQLLISDKRILLDIKTSLLEVLKESELLLKMLIKVKTDVDKYNKRKQKEKELSQ